MTLFASVPSLNINSLRCLVVFFVFFINSQPKIVPYIYIIELIMPVLYCAYRKSSRR